MINVNQLDLETQFFTGLLELHHGLDVQKKLKQISAQVVWAKQWPENNESFWNAEAFLWGYKINPKVRNLIKSELAFLNCPGNKNLDLGCGAYSYLSSTGFDFSEQMLKFNQQCSLKIKGDLEQKLPFSDGSFNSVTAIFVLNYLENYSQLLFEVRRILALNGIFVAVLSTQEINSWHQQKEKNSFSFLEWVEILKDHFSSVTFFSKENLCFFVVLNNKAY